MPNSQISEIGNRENKGEKKKSVKKFSTMSRTQRHKFPNWMDLVNTNGEGNGTPLQYSCLENPMDGGARWATVHGVTKSWTRLSDFTFTFHFHALEKEMATHSSVLAWRIPGTVEPGGLPSMGSHRVGHDWSDLAAAGTVLARGDASIGLTSQGYCEHWINYPWQVWTWLHH